MVIHWRSRRYRGGSGWLQHGLAVSLVGLTVAGPIVASGDEVTTEPAIFVRTSTTEDGVFSRSVTMSPGVFRRAVTAKDTER